MSANDVNNVYSLARGVYAKCRDCQGDYRNLANEVRAVQNGLQDLEDAVATRADPKGSPKVTELLQACEGTLKELSDLIDRFNALPLQSQRTWERMSWDQGGGDDIKHRLSKLAEQLGWLDNDLRNSPTAQLERALSQLAKEVSNGRHETSTSNSLATTAVDPDDDSGWDQIVRDLGDFGISKQTVTDNKPFVVDWILQAINSGLLTDEKLPVEDDTIPVQVSPPQSPPQRPPKTPISSHSHLHLQPPLYTVSAEPSRSNSPPYLNVDTVSRQPSISPPIVRPTVSTEVLPRSGAVNWDEPPSPIDNEPQDSNILWNAQRISHNWNTRNWSQARAALQEQIDCVQRGEFVEISGFPQQPDARILRHLLGVCYSYQGDFVKARETFESIMLGVYESNLPLDDGDMVAARWLGETCILANQVVNANLAWAIAYFGMVMRHPPGMPGSGLTNRMLEDLRVLNQKTRGLYSLQNAFLNSNSDISTILPNMPGTHKFQIVTAALEALDMPPTYNAKSVLAKNIEVGEGFLIQPLMAQTSWPFSQDPLFNMRQCIDLLYTLSRPRQAIMPSSFSTISLGSSSKLAFVTKNSAEWLVEAVRYALNTYAIEWKGKSTEYFLRLSQSYKGIAFYDCFCIQFRKLSLRSVYGFRIVSIPTTTRDFTRIDIGDEYGHGTTTRMTSTEDTARKEEARQGLVERIRDYCQQAEMDLARGDWPPRDLLPPALAPYEIEGNAVAPVRAEVQGQGNSWELDGRSLDPMGVELGGAPIGGNRVHRKPLPPKTGGGGGLPSYEIAELPG